MTAKYSRTGAPEAAIGPATVTIYHGDGTVKRVITGAELRARALDQPISDAPAIAPKRGEFILPTVSRARRKKSKYERLHDTEREAR